MVLDFVTAFITLGGCFHLIYVAMHNLQWKPLSPINYLRFGPALLGFSFLFFTISRYSSKDELQAVGSGFLILAWSALFSFMLLCLEENPEKKKLTALMKLPILGFLLGYFFRDQIVILQGIGFLTLVACIGYLNRFHSKQRMAIRFLSYALIFHSLAMVANFFQFSFGYAIAWVICNISLFNGINSLMVRKYISQRLGSNHAS